MTRFQIFLDFDGTITENDVGYEFFKRFTSGLAEAKVRQYRDGEINAIEVLQHECDLFNKNPVAWDQVEAFIARQTIRRGFPEFIEYLKEKDINITVLSAGFDFYINPIIMRTGFELKVLSTPTQVADGKLYPDFIHFNEAVCDQCANCKGYQIGKLLKPGFKSIFIGDGHSDYHGALEADIVFARSFLAEMLTGNNIEFYPYADFFDVWEIIKRLM